MTLIEVLLLPLVVGLRGGTILVVVIVVDVINDLEEEWEVHKILLLLVMGWSDAVAMAVGLDDRRRLVELL